MNRLSAVFMSFIIALAFGLGSASAETVVKWLHLETAPRIVAAWEQVVADYEAANPDVKVEMQFLENEAFKAKLTTLLQSDDRPDIFYSWGGGVLKAQIEAGVLRDIDGLMRGEWEETLSPAAVNAFTYDGKAYGVPHLVSQVGFWYNKALFAKAGVKAEDIKTWDDLLSAVKTIKAAGITPIAVGGAEKWPLHFYWTHLAIRIGGKAAFEAATSGEGEGFAGPVFVRAGDEFKRLIDLEPFQRGFLANTFPESAGYFGDGNAAMQLQGNWDYNTQKTNSVSKEGIPDENLGWFPFPIVEGGAGEPTDTLGGINGWIFSKWASDEAVDFMRFFVSPDNQRMMGREGFFIPVAKGAADEMKNPFFRKISENIAASKYHQIFYDQMLGPDVGRVVNDVSTDLAAGIITSKEAAATVQEAWEFEN